MWSSVTIRNVRTHTTNTRFCMSHLLASRGPEGSAILRPGFLKFETNLVLCSMFSGMSSNINWIFGFPSAVMQFLQIKSFRFPPWLVNLCSMPGLVLHREQILICSRVIKSESNNTYRSPLGCAWGFSFTNFLKSSCSSKQTLFNSIKKTLLIFYPLLH